MNQKQKGKYWYTLISKQAMNDLVTAGISESEAEEFITQFHDLGNYPDPCECREVKAIQRRDVPDSVIRFKPAYPYCLCRLRGIVVIFEYSDSSKKPVLALAGIFVRSEDTYDTALTNRLRKLGVMS